MAYESTKFALELLSGVVMIALGATLYFVTRGTLGFMAYSGLGLGIGWAMRLVYIVYRRHRESLERLKP